MYKVKNSLLLLAALLSACSISDDFDAAEAEVAKFRASVAAREFEKIYDDSHDEMKKVATKASLIDLLSNLNSKLGSVVDSSRTNARVNYRPTGTQIILSYAVKFEYGTANEHFIFLRVNDQLRLLGYHITDSRITIERKPVDKVI